MCITYAVKLRLSDFTIILELYSVRGANQARDLRDNGPELSVNKTQQFNSNQLHKKNKVYKRIFLLDTNFTENRPILNVNNVNK